jgi:hypothetical protein
VRGKKCKNPRTILIFGISALSHVGSAQAVVTHDRRIDQNGAVLLMVCKATPQGFTLSLGWKPETKIGTKIAYLKPWKWRGFLFMLIPSNKGILRPLDEGHSCSRRKLQIAIVTRHDLGSRSIAGFFLACSRTYAKGHSGSRTKYASHP